VPAEMPPCEINKDRSSPDKDKETRWVEHFKEVLNRPASEEEPDIPEAEEDPSVDTGLPKKDKIVAVMNSLGKLEVD